MCEKALSESPTHWKNRLWSLLKIWFGFFVQWHINLCRLFNAKAILIEEQWWYYLTHSWKDKRVHTFPKGICPKVNVIARLEYELAYYDSAAHRFNHYTTRTPPCKFGFAYRNWQDSKPNSHHIYAVDVFPFQSRWIGVLFC